MVIREAVLFQVKGGAVLKRIPAPWSSSAEAILYISLLLSAIGMVNVFSASFVLAGKEYGDSLFFIKRHIVYFLIGAVVFVSLARFDYRKLRPVWLPAALLTLALLVAVPFFGLDANGARRWLRIAGIVFQPSELAKLTVIFMVAGFLGPRLDRRLPNTLLSWPVIASGCFGYLVLKQPDMGTALVIVTLCLLLYLLAGISGREWLGLGVIGGSLFVYLVKAAAYRLERVMAWLDPWSYQQTSGYQAVQALLAIGSGGFFGSGLGMGASKFHYLPEAHTDFAFAVLSQEMGYLGAMTVIILFVLVGWHGIKIALWASDGFGQLLAVGITALVVGQAFGNIGMVSGLLPVTGVPLPFISYGGTSLVITLAALGVLFSVGRLSSKRTPAPPQEDSPEKTSRLRERVRLKVVKK